MFIHVSHAIDVVFLSFRWPQNLTQEFWFSLIRHQCVGCHHRSPKWLWFYFAQNIQKHLNHRKSETLTLISHASRATPSHTAHVQDLQMGDIVFLQVEFLAISHKLHDEQHRFHRSPTSFPCNYAGFEFSPYAIFQRHAQHHVLPNCGREHCLLQREPTPRLPTAVGSLVGS